MKDDKLAIVGATGLVGSIVLEILASKKILGDIDPDNLIFVASDKSMGKTISFLGKDIPVVTTKEAIAMHPRYVIMSAGASTSREVAPLFVEAGATVIDNSSAWRTQPQIPLIVPSISSWEVSNKPQIIANPNCVAIMLALSIAPFMNLEVEHISASAMQAVSGAGWKGLRAFEEELKAGDGLKFESSPFVSNIAGNIIPATTMNTNSPDYNEEEVKILFEVPKILGKQSLSLSAQSNRVPVPRGHSATVRITFRQEYTKDEMVKLLKNAPQIKYSEEPLGPYDVVGKDYAIIRSFRQDEKNPKVFEFFTTSDNLRVGAAYNAVAILGQIKGVYHEKNYS